MTRWTIRPGRVPAQHVTTTVPGDKSIGHRAVMLSALATGQSRVTGLSGGLDNRATIEIFRALGATLVAPEGRSDVLTVRGAGLRGGLRPPSGDLDCGNSGTTMRLMAGVLAGQPLRARLVGDASLHRRPMGRILRPLTAMGARVAAEGEGDRPPLLVEGGALSGIDYASPIASAQVKSAVLLAGLTANGLTSVTEPHRSRDHTERMLLERGVDVRVDGLRVTVAPAAALAALDTDVPGDPSSAAFPLAVGALLLDAGVSVARTGLNPTRTGFLTALDRMGAALAVSDPETSGGEPLGTVSVRRSDLRAVTLAGDLIPLLIDEVPILAVLAAMARGETTIRDAAELRVKESDRIATTAAQLRRMGARIEELPDGLVIEGTGRLTGAHVDSHGDHRIAMACAVAGLVAEGVTVVDDVDCVDTSFPGFVPLLRTLAPGAEITVTGA